MKLIGKEMRVGATVVTTQEKGIYVSFFIPAQTEQNRNTVRSNIKKWEGKKFSVEIRAAAADEENLEPWRGQESEREGRAG